MRGWREQSGFGGRDAPPQNPGCVGSSVGSPIIRTMPRKIPRVVWIAPPLGLLVYFYGLNAAGLIGPDEPRYASVARQMAGSGDWITPRLWGQPWFEKPALLYWMTAAAYRAGLG